MNPLQALTEALDGAQNELKSAEIALLEAKVRAEEARMAESRLSAAVAALKGEISGPPDPQPEERAEKPRKEVNSAPDNPYGHLKCSGCGVQGNMVPGAHGMFVCQTCGNMVG